jgi:predicted O-methyltransferase YrrM
VKAFRNVYLCLVHEKQECVVDLVHNLRVHDPASAILLYDGSSTAGLLTGFPFDRFDVTLVPDPRPTRWGRLHDFVLDSMAFAVEHCPFDALTIVDSDQLAIRRDYSRYLSGFLRSSDGVGMFVTDPVVQTRETTVGPVRAAWQEFSLWEPLLRYFGKDDRDFANWTFWPATVFTSHAAKALLDLVRSNGLAREVLERTGIWATEEVIFPTLVSLLGFELRTNPTNTAYVQYGATFSPDDVLAAIDTPDAFWMHPVPREYGNPVRCSIRRLSQRGATYADAPLPVTPTAMDGWPLVDAIEGWLTFPEATLLMTLAERLLEDASLPANFVEVGSFKGRSTVALAHVMQRSEPQGRVFAVDPHEGYVGAAESGVHALGSTFEVFTHNLAAAGVGSVVEPVFATTSSRAWSTPVSLVFVDGLHDYVNVARDGLMLEPALAPGGLMVFHDYSQYPGVTTFVEEMACSGKFSVIARAGSLIALQKHQAATEMPAAVSQTTRAGDGRTIVRRRSAPLVSCIMPTGYRSAWALRAIRHFLRQDYEARELVVIDEGEDDLRDAVRQWAKVRYVKVDAGLSVGAKRNIACELAAGDIILHWDDDDWSADWRIAYQVEQLLATGASVSGLADLIFCKPSSAAAWQYRYPRHLRPWVAGGTLCYRKRVWLDAPFECLIEGEDTAFVWTVSENDVVPCDLNTFYVASIHDRNTSVKQTDGPFWEPYSLERIRCLMAEDAQDYGL